MPILSLRMLPHANLVQVDNISGTIVGIWTPEMFHVVSVAGYHPPFYFRRPDIWWSRYGLCY